MPPKLKYNYLNSLDERQWVVKDNVQKLVLFRRLNLMREHFPFKGKFHVIFCRNVMIYFDAQTWNALIRRFYNFTEPGGFLFIGHSESLAHSDSSYIPVKPAVYRKEPLR